MAVVDVKVGGNLGILVLNNGKYNTLTDEVFKGLDAGVASLSANDAVKAVVVTANPGPVFCAGADVNLIAELAKSGDPGRIQRFLQDLHELILRLDNSLKPTIAGINGVCFGGGYELSLACDYLAAVPTAQFSLPEVSLGIIPGAGGTQRLPRRIGAKRALQYILSGERISASTALAVGVLDRVIEGDFIAGLKAFAADILAGKVTPRSVVSVTDADTALTDAEFTEFAKGRSLAAACRAVDAVQDGAVQSLSVGLGIEIGKFTSAVLHPDAEAGITAFLTKSKPNFQRVVGE